MICINVEQLLKKQKKSKYWFVKNMGGSYQSLSNLINNTTTSIHFETLERICEILDCEPGDIIIRKKGKRRKDKNKVYLFKVGIFYNILNEDARVVSNALGLKLTDLSPEIIKCGFPVAKLEKYTNLLKAHHIKYEVIANQTSSNQTSSYESIIKKIQSIDLNNTTFKEAFDILYTIQQKLKNIQ